MIWANSANTQVGDTKIFNNMGKSFVLVEATENGYVEVESGSYDELRSIYEQTYRKTTNKVYEHSKVLQSEQGRDFFDLFNDENRTNVGRYSEKIGEERFQNDTSRNNEYLQSSDKEKFSLKTNYLHEVALKNKKDTLTFKTEPRHESGLLSDNVSIYSLLNKLLNVNEGLKHPRKDNIVDFARGNLLLDILGNKYEADDVIGFTKYGMCELHDIVNMKPTTFEYKKEASYKDSSSKKGLSQKGNASLITLYPQTQKKVKKNSH